MKPYDPVSAISEAAATGETARIFADIRATMQIPFLTSIWRSLAAIDQGLASVWDATKPIIKSGKPAASVKLLKDTAPLPIPEVIGIRDLSQVGVDAFALRSIQTIIDVYNRSNTLNFLTLSALVFEPAGAPLERAHRDVSPIRWTAVPQLLEKEEIPDDIWQLLLQLNNFGASPDEPGLATLWRHLAHWPQFLELVYDHMHLLQREGIIQQSIESLLLFNKEQGKRLAHDRPDLSVIPAQAMEMVQRYVQHPGLVVRMVAVGLGLRAWLNEIESR